MALARSVTQTASSTIWTRVAESISYDDNRYAKRDCVHKFVQWLWQKEKQYQ